jgi:hypothetical protein
LNILSSLAVVVVVLIVHQVVVVPEVFVQI